MTVQFPWRTALKIAWRESRASSVKFIFVIAAVAVGVAALTSVRGFSRVFQTMLLREARTLMGADLSVRVFSMPTPGQVAVMDSYAKRGVRRTWITETLSMVSKAGQDDPVLVSVKAVEPSLYPFYGEVRLAPPGRLEQRLDRESVAVAEDLLIRLNAAVGDRVRLGGEEFRVAGVVLNEPDRMTGSLNVGLRLMITREGLERAGLIQTGSRAAQRFLFRLPPQGVGVEELRRELKKAFPDGMIADFRQAHPLIERGLSRATTFLSLVSLISLIVGSLGVAMAVHSHLQQRLDTIAIMKCLGARSNQILRIYVAQTMVLGLSGAALGVLLGYGAQAAFPALIARYFSLRPGWELDPLTAGQGLIIGVLTSLLFTVPPLVRIRRIRPGIIFRREMAEVRHGWKQRLRQARASVLAGAALLTGLALIAAWLGDSLKLGAFFAGGLAASLLVLAGVAWLLLRTLRWFLRSNLIGLPATVRHGIANIYRPGNHAEAVLVALGVGVMFTLSVYLVQRSLVAQILSSAPKDMPNVFLINITAGEAEGLAALLKQQKGVQGDIQLVPSVAARLTSVDGVPVDKLPLKGWERRFRRERSVTWSAAQPPHTQVLQGAWWAPDASEPVVSVAEEAARILNIKPGARLQWNVAGRDVASRVVAIHRTESIRMGANIEFVLNPPALRGLPVLYFGGLRMRPDAVGALQRATYREYPTVTVINVADVVEIVQDVVDQVAVVIRFVSLFAILGGVIILASSVAGTRFRRMREVAVLKTLGATRRRLAALFSVEFLILGAVAGLIGSALATGFSKLALERFFEAEYRVDVLPNLLCVVLTALLANFAGWVASHRILGQKPLVVLREE